MSLASRILKGTVTLLVSRGVSRLFSVISVLTVARWLGPEEMGVYGVAGLMLVALEQLSETGLRAALIQRSGDIASYIAPVRTVQAIRGVFLGGLVYFIAPGVAQFFGSPRSVEILRVIALVPVIQGIEPIFETLARKELNFGPIVKVQLASSLVGLLVGVVAAFVRPDAWALVYSTLGRVSVSALGYYWVSERSLWRFSFRWAPLTDLHSFGFWIFVNGIVSYIFMKGGEWVIGRTLSIHELALYQMAYLMSTVITGELAGILSSIMLPVFSKLQNDRLRLVAAFRFSFGATAIVTFFMAAILCACAPDFVGIVLGADWLPALVLIPWLTTWGVCSVFAGAMGGMMQALGRPKLWTQTVFIMVGMMVVGVVPMTRWLGSTGVAVLLASIGVVIQLFRYWIVARLLRCTYRQVVGHVAIPMVACVLAVTTVRGFVGVAFQASTWASLLTSGLGTSVVFLLVLVSAGTRLQPSIRQILEKARTVIKSESKPVAAIDWR